VCAANEQAEQISGKAHTSLLPAPGDVETTHTHTIDCSEMTKTLQQGCERQAKHKH
jgi:hypothetical protein